MEGLIWRDASFSTKCLLIGHTWYVLWSDFVGTKQRAPKMHCLMNIGDVYFQCSHFDTLVLALGSIYFLFVMVKMLKC